MGTRSYPSSDWRGTWGDDWPTAFALATGLGAASSSCTYAAGALARALVRRVRTSPPPWPACRTVARGPEYAGTPGQAVARMTRPRGVAGGPFT
jgi:hypothetical protein